MNIEHDSLGTEGSNDETGIKKLNPVLIRLFDDNRGKVSVQLLYMAPSKEGTAEVLFNNINSILREKMDGWENCVAVELGNTALNVRKKNSIIARVLVNL